MRKSFLRNADYRPHRSGRIFRIAIYDSTYIVSGPSMEPNYRNSEWIIVEKLAYKFANVRRGRHHRISTTDIKYKIIIKRIIGLPGETVEIKDGAVDIQKADGSIITLQEPYIKEPFSSTYTSIVIPPNEYFVMGG